MSPFQVLLEYHSNSTMTVGLLLHTLLQLYVYDASRVTLHPWSPEEWSLQEESMTYPSQSLGSTRPQFDVSCFSHGLQRLRVHWFARKGEGQCRVELINSCLDFVSAAATAGGQ